MRTSRMMMTGMLVTAMSAVMSTAMHTAQAESASTTELQVQLANQQIPDPSYGLVSEGHALTTFQVRVLRPLRPDLNLDWFASYEYGATSNQGSAYETNSTYGGITNTRLALHGLEAGVRLTFPVGRWLTPYAAVSGRALIGSLRIEDELSGWQQPDPNDATGESNLYEASAVHDVGFGGGVQGAIGLAVRMKPKAHRVALAMRMAADDPSAGAASGATGAGETSPAATAERKPAGSTEAGSAASEPKATPAAVEPKVTGSGETAPAAAAEVKPARAGEAGASEAAPIRLTQPVTPVLPVATRQSGWDWGLNLELSYPLLSDIHFVRAGALDVQGLRVQGGVMVSF